jgi:hypothetical protein
VLAQAANLDLALATDQKGCGANADASVFAGYNCVGVLNHQFTAWQRQKMIDSTREGGYQ